MIARVFPRRTNMTPTDENAFVGEPPLGCPQYDEVHISCCFTWDRDKSYYLAEQWRPYGEVKVGGPALSKSGGDFVPGWYIKEGVTITSRGCPNKCRFCLVPQREGELRELRIWPGSIVQDSNLLACSEKHINKVFEMLKSQRGIVFAGGLEAKRITVEIADRLSKLKVERLCLSYDMPTQKTTETLQEAIQILREHFKRRQLKCYVLIGYEDDTIAEAERRLLKAWDMGTLPFAMRYRLPSTRWGDSFLFRERAWSVLTAKWTQVKTIFSSMNKRDNLVSPRGA